MGGALLLKTIRVFFDDGVGEDLTGDALDLRAGGVCIQVIGEGECVVQGEKPVFDQAFLAETCRGSSRCSRSPSAVLA